MLSSIIKIEEHLTAGLKRLLARRVPDAWINARVVFGLSTGRCGTTSLTRLVQLSRQVEAVHEIDPLPSNPLRVAPFYSLETARPTHRDAFVIRRAQRIHLIQTSGKVYVELNGMKFHAPVIAELMPESRFFFVHRHPAEFVRSGMRRGWYESHPADRARLTPRQDDPVHDDWNRWSRLEKIAWLWSATNDYFLNFLDRFESTSPERTKRFRFDSLMDYETGDYLKLFELIGVDSPPEHEVRDILSTRFNAQQSGSFPEFEEWSESDRQALLRIAGPTMTRLGYRV